MENNIRFNDRGEGPPPLPVDEPVDQVSAHLRCSRVQLEEPKSYQLRNARSSFDQI